MGRRPIIEIRTTKYGRRQTVIEMPGLDDGELHKLLHELKHRLGTGGYIEDGKIILRGDLRHRAKKVIEQWVTGARRKRKT